VEAELSAPVPDLEEVAGEDDSSLRQITSTSVSLCPARVDQPDLSIATEHGQPILERQRRRRRHRFHQLLLVGKLRLQRSSSCFLRAGPVRPRSASEIVELSRQVLELQRNRFFSTPFRIAVRSF
jgi:hypothetical protein